MKRRALLLALLLLTPLPAWAAGGGAYPWEGILQRLVASVSGPVAGGIGVLSIVGFGLTLAFSEGGGLRVVLGIVFGLAIAFSAVSILASFFGFAGGALWT